MHPYITIKDIDGDEVEVEVVTDGVALTASDDYEEVVLVFTPARARELSLALADAADTASA